MNVEQMVRRFTTVPPEVLILDTLEAGRIVHAVYEVEDEQRREVFVVSSRTWSEVEKRGLMLTPTPATWRVRYARDVGVLSDNGRILLLPVPLPPVLSMLEEDGATIPPSVTAREWRIAL